jgi:hypothetical protein
MPFDQIKNFLKDIDNFIHWIFPLFYACREFSSSGPYPKALCQYVPEPSYTRDKAFLLKIIRKNNVHPNPAV